MGFIKGFLAGGERFPGGILWPDLGLQLLLSFFIRAEFGHPSLQGLKSAFKVLTVIWETEPGHSGAPRGLH